MGWLSGSCLLVRRAAFFALLERHPTLVRGFLLGLTQRIVELTRRIPEVAGGRVETRFAHLFLKLADKAGRPRPDGTFIPMALGAGSTYTGMPNVRTTISQRANTPSGPATE